LTGPASGRARRPAAPRELRRTRGRTLVDAPGNVASLPSLAARHSEETANSVV